MQYLPPVVPAVVTSPIGYRCTSLGCEYHKGIDLKCDRGQPVRASNAGTVAYAGWAAGGLGYLVAIAHIDGNVTYYGHNSRVIVAKGSYVKAGQTIAECGATGRTTGSHIHLEIRDKKGQTVTPAQLGIDL